MDYSQMSEEELDAAADAMSSQDSADESHTPDGAVQPDAQQSPDEGAQQSAGPDAEALRAQVQAYEEEKARWEADQRQAAEKLSQWESWYKNQADAARKQEMAELEDLDPVEALRRQVQELQQANQHAQQRHQQEIQAAEMRATIRLSEAQARQRLGVDEQGNDVYTARLGELLAMREDPLLGDAVVKALEKAQASHDPAQAAMTIYERLVAPKAAMSQAEIDAKIADGIKAAMAKMQSGGRSNIAHINAAGAPAPSAKSFSRMTLEELEAEQRRLYG